MLHDLVPLLYPQETPRLWSYYKKLLPMVFEHTAAVIAVSQYTRSDILQRYKIDPAKVHFCYNGLEQAASGIQAERRPADLPSEPYFLFIGTFAPRKNLETLFGLGQGTNRSATLAGDCCLSGSIGPTASCSW